jgi:dTMP kinase
VTVRGRFITVEGIDGAGKSSHIQSMCAILQAHGCPVVSTREPGGTPLGERLRELLLSESMDLETEALLMFAARREHVVRVIEPALASGQWVLSDRFTDASFAYQASARGINWERMRLLETWVLGSLQPDLTLLFDLPPEVAAHRMSQRAPEDRFEREALDFHQRVRTGYQRRMVETPGRFVLIDANSPLQTVAQSVEAALTERLRTWRP